MCHLIFDFFIKFWNWSYFVYSLDVGGVLAYLPRRTLIIDDKCDKSSIQINQAPTTPLPNGIPQYTVEIVNTCLSGYNISNIHIDCGMFSSARLIDPTIFKRLNYSDCLVNSGKPFPNGKVISFSYANTYPYPLSVSSVVCYWSSPHFNLIIFSLS